MLIQLFNTAGINETYANYKESNGVWNVADYTDNDEFAGVAVVASNNIGIDRYHGIC